MRKICRNCKELKENTEFYKEPRSKSGLSLDCKECHKEKMRAKRNARRAKYPWLIAEERIKKDYPRAIVPLTAEEEEAKNDFYLEARDANLKHGFTRADSQSPIYVTVDHITPLIMGGLHIPTNLQLLTRSQNASKNKF